MTDLHLKTKRMQTTPTVDDGRRSTCSSVGFGSFCGRTAPWLSSKISQICGLLEDKMLRQQQQLGLSDEVNE